MSADIRVSFYEAEHLGGENDLVSSRAAVREERRPQDAAARMVQSISGGSWQGNSC